MKQLAGKSHIKPLAALAGIAWLTSLLAVVWCISMEDRFFAVSGKPIAFLKEKRRSVTFRTEDDIKWKPASSRQGFFDGDRLSTGPDGSATIDFGEGRKGLLGPDTIVSISSINQSSGKSFIVNLVKGAIKPIVPANAKNQLIVTSGLNTYFVEPGEARGFAKPVGGVIKEFSSREKFPIQAKQPPAPAQPKYIVPAAVSQQIASLPSVVLASVPASELSKLDFKPALDTIDSADEEPEEKPIVEPEPIVAPAVANEPPTTTSPPPITTPEKKPAPAKPEFALASLLPRIDSNSLGSTYLTFKPITGLVGQSFSVKVRSAQRKLSHMRTGIQIDMGKASTQAFVGRDEAVSVVFTKAMISAATRTTWGAVPCLAASARTFVTDTSTDEGKTELSKEIQAFSVCSLLDAKSNLPLTVSLTKLEPGTTGLDLFVPFGSASNYPIQITITRADDYTKILPYLSRSAPFRISATQTLAPQGVFSVLNGRISSQLNDDIKPVTANKIMEIFDHSFVFRGPRNSIYNASGMEVEKFKSWISEKTSSGATVFVRAKGSLIPVSRDFMNESSEVAAFVKSAAGSVFLQKVDIISYKAE